MLKKPMVFFAVLTLLVGCSSTLFAQELKSPVGAKHVVWIGSDGFGSHYLDWDELPNLRAMRDSGAWTLHMRSMLPSSSAINWESQLAGAPSEMHGHLTWRSREPDIPPIYRNEQGRFPDIFRVLKDQKPDFKGTVAHSWIGIGFLYDRDAVSAETRVKNDDVLQAARAHLATKPDFAFICFSEPDPTGHNVGWGTPEYHKALQFIDGCVGKIFECLKENGYTSEDTVVIFTSDHGGSGQGHGDPLMEHMEVPFLIWGAGVQPGEIKDVVANFDVASTIAWVLGAEQPQCWRGQCVKAAFEKK
ncbi:MAG: alkaline phosphatase [Thermoguttaceae bacterium]|nr:alkaline phosphatase [Thermoguttaceae bacterium]